MGRSMVAIVWLLLAVCLVSMVQSEATNKRQYFTPDTHGVSHDRLADFWFEKIGEDKLRVGWLVSSESVVHHTFLLDRISDLYSDSSDPSARHTYMMRSIDRPEWVVGSIIVDPVGGNESVVLLHSRDGIVSEIGPAFRYLAQGGGEERHLETIADSQAYVMVQPNSGLGEGNRGRSLQDEQSYPVCGALRVPPLVPQGASSPGQASTVASGSKDELLELVRAGRGEPLDEYERRVHGHHRQLRSNEEGSSSSSDEHDYFFSAAIDQYAFYPGCYDRDSVAHVIEISVGTDTAFFRKGGSNLNAVRAEVELAVATTSAVYQAQMNVRLKIKELRMATESVPDEWGATYKYGGQVACPGSANTMLDTFTQQVHRLPTEQKSAHWHFLTGCSTTGGTVGLAYVGTVCEKYYNTGLTVRTSNMWRILAHEIGHGVGASHSFENGVGKTGGLMDYGNGKLLGTNVYRFIQTRKEQMCSQLAEVRLAACPYFYIDQEATNGCGDGVLKDDEECECENGSTSCAGCVKCKLTNPEQQCSPNTFFMHYAAGKGASGKFAAKECCVGGMLEPVSTTCNGGAGVCNQGECVDPCQAHGLSYCGAGSGNGCRIKCLYEANNVCSPNWAHEGQRITDMPSGSICTDSSGNSGTCNGQGACVTTVTSAPSDSPSKSPTTKRPTPRPTTRTPTGFPTARPSISPTTQAPTGFPTARPSTSPTRLPTRRPSTSPTTKAPTGFPTRFPTRVKPTRRPTRFPTGRPTRAPVTARPTPAPTFKTISLWDLQLRPKYDCREAPVPRGGTNSKRRRRRRRRRRRGLAGQQQCLAPSKGVLQFGRSGKYLVKPMEDAQALDYSCDQGFFGGNPLPSKRKFCYFYPVADFQWKYFLPENRQEVVPRRGIARYGRGGEYSYRLVSQGQRLDCSDRYFTAPSSSTQTQFCYIHYFES